MKRALGVAALLCLAACRGNTEPVAVTAADAGSTVMLHAGQRLRVELDSNPTTGYRWQLALPADAPLRSEGDAEYRPDPHAAGLVGAGGHEIWSFRAERTGNVTLHFEYRRPFESGPPPGRSADFRVSVR
ncbi:protease inhibitor I42 family protein [Solimonas soli]|uniref:protease inhibitor I42 family protein n=1 Tax=Solimonas soli TaxID=413479 RepID=UPI000481B6FB|nr:protease inhibitor I42 family protein [Solimonas soli]